MGCGEAARLRLPVRHPVPCLLGDDARRRPIPEAEPALVVPIQPARGDPAQIQRRSARSANVADPRKHASEHGTLLAASFSVVPEARGDERRREPGRRPHLKRLPVQGGSGASLRREQLLAKRIEHHAKLALKRDRDCPAWKAVEEVRGAVERIDDPAPAGDRLPLAALSPQHAVFRPRLKQPRTDQFLGIAIGRRDHVGGRRLDVDVARPVPEALDQQAAGRDGQVDCQVEVVQRIALSTTTITTIARQTRPTCTRKRNMSRSERRGFHISLKDVDGRVDDDPHDVDEVPVDTGHLDTAVLLGRVVAAERPDRREREKDQADGHVRAVQSGQAVEDRALSVVADGPAEMEVLVDLDREEGQSEQEGRQEAGLHRALVVVLDPLDGPVHRERRRDEDARVDAGDEHRDRMPRCRPGVPLHDADEEVRREERSEEHDLADDEEVHPQGLGIDRRREVRRRRPVVLALLLVKVCCDAGGFHQAGWPSWALGDEVLPATTCSTGLPVAERTRPTRSARSQPERSGSKVEMMMSSTGYQRTAFWIAVNGSGWTTWPTASTPSSSSCRSTCARRSYGSPSPPSPCGRITTKRWRPSVARLLMRSSSCWLPTVWLATTSVSLPRSESLGSSTTTCSTGRRVACLTRSIRSRRSQPERVSGWVEMMISS